jgi:hypothetical protein
MHRQMLILTGPQGAGNHLWSKVFSQHPEVYGWKTLLENYWEPHRFNEPFAQYWRDPAKLKDFDWTQSEHYFTSISVPLGIPGDDVNPLWEPNLQAFQQAVHACGVNTRFAVVGRDQNILREQQTRIRTQPTLPMFMQQMPQDPIFLSYELLYLYQDAYVRSLDVNIPVDPNVAWMLEDDANAKYVHGVDRNELDQGNRRGIIFKHRP